MNANQKTIMKRAGVVWEPKSQFGCFPEFQTLQMRHEAHATA
jgi:hypothetical protein